MHNISFILYVKTKVNIIYSLIFIALSSEITMCIFIKAVFQVQPRKSQNFTQNRYKPEAITVNPTRLQPKKNYQPDSTRTADRVLFNSTECTTVLFISTMCSAVIFFN